MKKRRKSKRKLRRSAQKAAMYALIALLVLLLFWPYIRSSALKAFIAIGRGERGYLEQRVSGDLVLAGGVTLLISPSDGNVNFLIQDGSPVRVGDVIAEVGSPQALSQAKGKLDDSQRALSEFDNANAEGFQVLSRQVEDAYRALVEAFLGLQTAYANGVSYVPEVEQEVQERASRLNRVRGELIALETQRAELVADLRVAEQIAATSSVKILSPVAGTFKLGVPDAKLVNDPAQVQNMDASQMVLLSKQIRSAKVKSVKNGDKVSKGQVLGMVVSGHDVSFGLACKTESRPNTRPGDEASLILEQGTILNVTVRSVSDGNPPGYSVITGSVDYVPASVYVFGARGDLVTERRYGIVIPKSSILEKDGKLGVLVVQKTYAEFRQIEVLMEKGDQAVVKGISETDEIVLRAHGFLEGRRVR